jgi:replicative DNA helicase
VSIPIFIPDIEQEVLGTLLSGASFPTASLVLETRHFIDPAHQIIYEACANAHDNYASCKLNVVSKLIDDDAIRDALKKDNLTKKQYLAQLVANTYTGRSRLSESCRKVVEQWARISISEEFTMLAEASADSATNIRRIVTYSGEKLDDIMSDVRRGTGRKSRYSLYEASQEGFKAADEARMRKGLTGITWGLSEVNRLTGGIQKRDLTLIAARPSIGKTTLAMSCALKAAKMGHGIGFISLEMDAQKIALRSVSDFVYDRGIRIPYANVIRGDLSETDLNRIREASSNIEGLPLIIEDQSGLRMSDIRVKIERLIEDGVRADKPISCIIVDHIGLIKPSSRYSGNRVNEISEISAGLKALAREYDIAVVALSQLSRGVESRDDKRPVLSDLRDSGAIEQDADTVVFLYREAYYLERKKAKGDMDQMRIERLIQCQNEMEFIIAKQRNGPVTTVKLHADMAFSAIRTRAA